jgi:hypothetical protein
MFYQGDLQSGIAKALQESKLVACFVTGTVVTFNLYYPRFPNTSLDLYYLSLRDPLLTLWPDDGEESRMWENDFLEDPSVSFFGTLSG